MVLVPAEAVLERLALRVLVLVQRPVALERVPEQARVALGPLQAQEAVPLAAQERQADRAISQRSVTTGARPSPATTPIT